jgi:hypothetical protein
MDRRNTGVFSLDGFQFTWVACLRVLDEKKGAA